MSPRLYVTAWSCACAAALALPVMAQDAKPAMAGMPAASASMPMDCPMMKDGQATGMPMGKEMPMGKDGHCADMKATTAKPSKARPVHDHAKFHKNQ